MSGEDLIKKREKLLSYYYKNREKRILYQREYDKSNKEKKKAQDKKRRETTNKNKLRVIQAYSRKHYYPVLLKKYKGCQICNSKFKLEVHHKRYTKKLKDCMIVCQPCHKKIHRKVKE